MPRTFRLTINLVSEEILFELQNGSGKDTTRFLCRPLRQFGKNMRSDYLGLFLINLEVNQNLRCFLILFEPDLFSEESEF